MLDQSDHGARLGQDRVASVNGDSGAEKDANVANVATEKDAVKSNDTSTTEPGAESYAAIMATNKPNPFGRGYISLYLLVLPVCLCSTMNGFDAALIASINALPSFNAYFGLPEKGSAATGIIFSIFQIGTLVGAFFVWLADYYGRKRQIFFGCLGVCVGTIINALSINVPMLIGSRFVLSFFVTWAHSAAPLYLVEIAPGAYRGTIAGMYQTFYFIGAILATSTVYGTHLHLGGDGNKDWRIPLWLQMVFPGLVLFVALFLPESPRWLIAQGRHEEARKFFVKYHANGDEKHPLVDLQMRETAKSLEDQSLASPKELFDVRVLFESRASRYRIMLNMVFSWFSQFSGNNIISYYLPIMLKGIGVTNTNLALILNIVYSVVGWVFSVAGARLHDIVGRRKMLIGSTVGMIMCLTIVAACSAGFVKYHNDVSPTVSIVFIFMFGAVFAVGYTPMQPIYPAEVVSNKMRAKAVGVAKITGSAAGFLNTFAGPIALSNIGYWFYVFFVFWDTFEAGFIYFFFVETKGLTLEELDDVFEEKNPRKASVAIKKRRAAIIKGQGE